MRLGSAELGAGTAIMLHSAVGAIRDAALKPNVENMTAGGRRGGEKKAHCLEAASAEISSRFWLVQQGETQLVLAGSVCLSGDVSVPGLLQCLWWGLQPRESH